MNFLKNLLIVLGFSTLWACDNSRIFELNIDYKDKVWHEDSVPRFSFQIADPDIHYNLYYNLRNTRAYPYRNLYVQYSLEDSTGRVISSDLQNINLFDPTTGKPLGSGMSDIYDHQVLALEEFNFPSGGLYHFKIQQFMRMQNLPEIVSVGLRVEKAE